MTTLSNELRNILRRAIEAARVLAESGAQQALESLAVHHHEPHGSMNANQRALRNRLRAHGRQLGDVQDTNRGTQAITRLVREVAYEHWHRMLFARFLAECGLLVEPASGVAITMEECTELAREKNEDPWAMAASFAQSMLPAIFRTDDPALAVTLPPECRQGLHTLVATLPPAVFSSRDALGWTYQFWQSAEKEAVNKRVKSGEKITGETLPAVTQLFTEPYMVLFLLHNTIGAWHAAKILQKNPALAIEAADEQDLRAAVALADYKFEYLRFVRDPRPDDLEGNPRGPWRPAAGSYEAWPHAAAEIKVLDPCCGSGHFLVEAFVLLTRLRMAEEGLSLESAMRAVLKDNLFGLELDARCTQIAAFNVALVAWREIEKCAPLPPLQIACSGLGPNTTKERWMSLAEKIAEAGEFPIDRDLFGGDDSELAASIRTALETVYDLFSHAPELGSLIDPHADDSNLYWADFSVITLFAARMLSAGANDIEIHEHAIAAQGMAKAAEILVGPPNGYTLVITNVPYLGRGNQSEYLREFSEKQYNEAKADLATVFLRRMFRWIGTTGTAAVVTPQNWLFLTSYQKLRSKLLYERTWNFVTRLGAGAFGAIGGHVVNVALLAISGGAPVSGAKIAGLDVSVGKTPQDKAALLRGEPIPPSSLIGAESDDSPATDPNPAIDEDSPAPADQATDPTTLGHVQLVSQSQQLKNPDARIVLIIARQLPLLSLHSISCQGIATGDDARARRQNWELGAVKAPWALSQSSSDALGPIGGCSDVFLWGCDGSAIDWPGAALRGRMAWRRFGIGVANMRAMSASLYFGGPYDQNLHVLIPTDPSNKIVAIFCFCASREFAESVRRIDQKLNVTNATLVKVPFDLAHWQRIAAETYPHGLPEPQSNDPTQWLFHGHPAGMTAAGHAGLSPFGVADPIGADRHLSLICRTPNPGAVLQVAVARLLGYRWPAESDPEMRLDSAARAWVDRCADLLGHADADGIVVLSPARGELPAADRLRRLLVAAFGDRFTASTEAALLMASAAEGEKPAATLEEWLRDHFFEEHVKLFHHRPFVWHIWDGRKDGFHVLVNYHRLAGADGQGRRTLEAITFTYLGEWIDRQRVEQSEGKDGADGRLVAALILQGEMKKILEGEPPYDIFVRWKSLAEQPIGWEPDVNDGVRLNIRPFLMAKDVGKKGAGILRFKPNIKWTKDRGQEPQSLRPRDQYPWFWGADPESITTHRTDFGTGLPDTVPAAKDFTGTRWNLLHYSRAAKEAARERARNEVTS